MTITTRQKRQNISFCTPVDTGNENIDAVATHTVLWMTTDSNLSWTNHVNELTKSVFHKLYQLSTDLCMSSLLLYNLVVKCFQLLNVYLYYCYYYLMTVRNASVPSSVECDMCSNWPLFINQYTRFCFRLAELPPPPLPSSLPLAV